MAAEEVALLRRFYQTVLSWDLYRIIQANTKNKEKGETTAEGLGFGKVQDSYTDVKHYVSTYEPLLFEEIKSEIAIKFEGKRAVLKEFNEDQNGFHMAEVCVLMDEGEDEEEKVKRYDLFLLSKPEISFKNYAFALVENRTKESIWLRMYLNTDAIQACPRRSLATCIARGDKVFDVTKICSLSTSVRQYIALGSIGSLTELSPLILAPSERNAKHQAWKVSKPLEEYIKGNLNESQQEAIHAGLSRKPFVLIQGPPGTGKTQTILSLLSALLHATPGRVNAGVSLLDINQKPQSSFKKKLDQWRLASTWLSTGGNPREKTMPVNGDEGFFPTTGNELKPEVVSHTRKRRVRVLVCAPSNSALDEIVLRVMNNGLRDESDRSYRPRIVRIGVKDKAHHSIRSVCMYELLETKKRSMGGAKQDRADNEAEIFEEAEIVFSTLSSSAPSHNWGRRFDVVIIDEAAQAVEPATLVPLANGCEQVFLIGDPEQLPATVKSEVAKKFGYPTSMFARFKNAGYPVTMLKIQYRMHPEISRFPSKEFYENSLKDGPSVEELTEQRKSAWHEYSCFGPFCFFDLHEGKETKSQASLVNVDEVEFVLSLYYKMVCLYPELKSSKNIAIISTYRAQVKLLKERFKSLFGVDSEKEVEITTVDGCQGREKDVAIFTCVRANEEGGIGFVDDYRRLNVGITRAKASVLVVGSASTLQRSGKDHWNNLVKSAQERDKRRCYFQISKPYAAFFSEESLESMRIKEEIMPSEEKQNDEVDYSMPTSAAGDADEMQGDDNGCGEGDGEFEYD